MAAQFGQGKSFRNSLGVSGNMQVLGVVDDAKIQAQLEKLSGRWLLDVLESAEKQIGQKYLSSLRSATPRGPTGNLQAAQTFKVGLYKSAAVLMFGPKYYGGQHQHLVEWGTQNRWVKTKAKGGKYKGKKITRKTRKAFRGRIKAQHYLEKWFEANKSKIRSDLANEINSALGTEAYT